VDQTDPWSTKTLL